MGWLAIIIIAFANSVTGWAILRRWTTDNDLPTQLFTAIALGTAVNGYATFILAELGSFRWETVGGIWLLIVVTASYLTRAKHNQAKRAFNLHPSTLILFFWLLFAAVLFFRPHQFVRGGADAGVYVNLAVNIAETGSITIHDPIMATLDPALYHNLLRPLPDQPAPYYRFPAIFYDGDGSGTLTPQFYHLHPVWQAVAALIGGVHGVLLLNGLWALLGTLAVYFTMRELFGETAALLTLAALTLNALQVWFARYPTTEPLTQFYVWTGIWAFSKATKRSSRPPFAFLSALCFGSAMLTRIDMFFFAALPLGLVVYQMVTRTRPPIRHLSFSLPFSIVAAHSFIHGYVLSRPYFLDTFAAVYLRLVRNWELPVLVAGIGLVAVVVFGRLRHHRWIKRYGTLLIILPLLTLALYAQFIRPYADPLFYNERISEAVTPVMDHVNFIRLGWYLSPLGVWLGILGTCWLIWRVGRTADQQLGKLLFLSIGLLFTVLYIWKLQANHHQIYAMRRYVPVTLPFLIGCGACLIRQIGTSVRGELYERPLRHVYHLRTLCMAAVALLWLAGFAWLARGFVTQVDDAGSYEAIAQMTGQLDAHNIVLFNDPPAFGQGDMLGTTLYFMHGIDLFVVHDTAAIDKQAFENQLKRWQEDGRTLYWITPTGNSTPFPLADWQLANNQPYSVQFDFLEPDYFEKPTEIWTMQWQGIIEEVTIAP